MTDKDYYNYYQVLKYNGNYTRATEVFAKINSTEFKNIRSALTHHADYHEFLKDSSNFTIGKLEGVNGEHSEWEKIIM
ncbi:MAG: hypothetical protein IPG08_02700 [Sphingobacteriaceae bacterium]|nr:hypothetical protein [Sphingobacteriaceae bacterium]